MLLKTNMTTIRIKNMVCPRCVAAVRRLLAEMGFRVSNVELGEAVLEDSLDHNRMEAIGRAMLENGFELLEDSQAVTVDALKRGVLAWVRTTGERTALSDYLQGLLLRDYSSLSKLFSETCGITIERYSIMQRVEYAKELLCYGQKSAKEIAFELGYSSPAHFSSQFKRETGLSPASFRKDIHGLKRLPIDSL